MPLEDLPPDSPSSLALLSSFAHSIFGDQAGLMTSTGASALVLPAQPSAETSKELRLGGSGASGADAIEDMRRLAYLYIQTLRAESIL